MWALIWRSASLRGTRSRALVTGAWAGTGGACNSTVMATPHLPMTCNRLGALANRGREGKKSRLCRGQRLCGLVAVSCALQGLPGVGIELGLGALEQQIDV